MNKELTLADFFRFILSKLKLILIFGCIAAVAVFCFVKVTAQPKYNYSGSMIVNPFGNVNDSYTPNAVYNELTISRTLIPTYVEVLESKGFGEFIANQVNKGVKKGGTRITANQVIGMTRYTTDSETLVIDFRCSFPDKKIAYKVAKTISEMSPDYVATIIDHSKMKPVDTISESNFGTSAANPTVLAMVAFAVAAVIVVIVTLLIELLDNRIKSIEDITEHFNYPVLGTIPNFFNDSREEDYYGNEKKQNEKSAKQ